MGYFPEPFAYSKTKIKVELDLSNYGTKLDLSNYAAKCDLKMQQTPTQQNLVKRLI